MILAAHAKLPGVPDTGSERTDVHSRSDDG